MTQPLWVHTPLIYSQLLSESLDCDVYLKMETLQPSQSFKYRGMSHVAQIVKSKSSNAHLVVASGGNAGFAVACAAHAVNAKCTVFLPSGLDAIFLNSLLREGANLVVGGKDYTEVLAKARAAVAADKDSFEVSAYDDEDVWQGHASMVHEIAKDDLKEKPDAIFCSVGGGGLLAGVIVGCEQVGWDDVPVVALETIGADCYYHSVQANRSPLLSTAPAPPLRNGITVFHDEQCDVNLVRLPAIESVASSLGASSAAAGAVKKGLERKGGVRCVLVPDGLAMQTAISFADDHKSLVELACSTTLVPAYRRSLFDAILPPRRDGKRRKVVFIVCGGSKVSLEDMAKYQNIVNLHSETWRVWVEGKEIEIQK